MKRTFIRLSACFLALQTFAQGTVYLSSLDFPSSGSVAVASDSWVAQEFNTGGNPGGYWLDSIQLSMADAVGNPSGYRITLYGGTFYEKPGSSLQPLAVATIPTSAGVYTFVPTSDFLLSRYEMYFIVATAATPTAGGSYQWNHTVGSPANPLDGWYGMSSGFGFWTSSDGTSWTLNDGSVKFAVTATPVPEPSLSWLLLLASAVLALSNWWRVKHP